MSGSQHDHLVENYLAAVQQALHPVPAIHRTELLTDLREHIAVERAVLVEESESQVRSILDRLGDPDVVAAAALDEQRYGTPAAAPAPDNGAGAGQRNRRRWSPLGLALTALAVVLTACLAIGFFARLYESDAGSPQPAPSSSGQR
jgi:uncharacterized membrane protein